MSEKKKKTQYRLRNWSEYNRALVNRGSLTLWFDEAAIQNWLNREKTGRRGRSRTYADVAIECMMLMQSVFGMGLRQTQGFVESLMELLQLELPVADYSTLSRRRKHLKIALPRQRKSQRLHVVVDSTGLKVFGYGEWRLRQYYQQDSAARRKPRQWRKVHLGVDEATGEVVACVVTESHEHDKTWLPDVLAQVEEPIDQVSADKGYDYHSCYEVIEQHGARGVIPPRKGARIHETGYFDARDAHLRRIQEIGREAWKRESGYHRRSLAETAVYRLKTIFGPQLSSRTLENQAVETRLRCKALNLMTQLGMPDAYPVTAAA